MIYNIDTKTLLLNEEDLDNLVDVLSVFSDALGGKRVTIIEDLIGAEYWYFKLLPFSNYSQIKE